MTRKHFKHSILTHYVAATVDDIEGIETFDDRTLASLAGRPHESLSDGHNDDNPYRELPLERWRDADLRKSPLR